MTFEYIPDNDLFDPKIPGGIIFHITSGNHYFKLERTNSAELKYYHASPGTGTRVATIDLKPLPKCEQVFIAFSWAPEGIKLHIGPKIEGAELVSANGILSDTTFKVDKEGSIVQIGGPGVKVIGARVNIDGKQMVKPTAIEAWNETKKAIEILLTGESKEGYIFEAVKSNLCIVMMVTGFEAYCETRYQEIEDEGCTPDIERVQKKLSKRKENFQDFNGYCKEIYKYGYGIKFAELVNSNEYNELVQIFKFRNRIVHASPMLTMVNEFEVPKKEPIFSTNITNHALSLFDKFVNALHIASLRLRND